MLFKFSSRSFFVVGLFYIAVGATAQNRINSLQQTDAKTVYTIPFELTSYNNIIVRAVLNGRDTVKLMLHTAASDITLTEEAAKRLTSIKTDGSVQGVQSWGGGTNSADYSKGNVAEIGGLKFSGVTIWKDVNSGQGSDGKIGLQMFNGKVVQFDFDKSVIVIADSLPKDLKSYTKLPVGKERDMLFVPGICSVAVDTFHNRFLIHSGYGGAILLDDQFAADRKLGERLLITGKQDLYDAYGHTLTTKKAILPRFTIGAFQIDSVPVGFFEGAIGRQKMSVIGGELIKRFNWVIDAGQQYVYIRRNRFFRNGFTKS